VSGRSFEGRAFLCLLAGGCCIAFAPIFVRLSDTGPVASAFWRVALAAPMLWLWVWREDRGSDSNRSP
jgi:drug/metabolite transporter (DMT)-like permease